MLTSGAIMIWQVSPETMQGVHSLPGSGVAALLDVLSSGEQRRAAAFHAEEHRREYIAAHAALRHALGWAAGVAARSIEIGGAHGAKPALIHGSDLRFNLSHTRGAALIAAARGCEVGIDIEEHRAIDDLEAMARAVMSTAELAAWTRLDTKARMQAFYNLWTRKEAYLKAIGLGLFHELHSITVPVTAKLLAGPVRVQDAGAEGRAVWQLVDLPVWPGYSAAVCWEGDELPRIERRELSLAELT